MNTYPLLEADLDKIRDNAAAITKICAAHNIRVAGVVKGCCGSVPVAKAMLAGGVSQIADSRIPNIERLRENGINCELLMLRIPMLSQVPDLVRLCDTSLNSEHKVIEALGCEALKSERVHKVILMIDLGDLREGVQPQDAPYLAERIMEMEGVKLEGIGTNLTCYGGVVPTEENMGVLAKTALAVESRIGRKLDIVSGGNSSSLPLIISGKMPPRINHIRIGEAILLGQDTITNKLISGTVRNAFTFKAEVIEAGRKPSAPVGEIARDAFGNKPDFKDMGIRRRAILGAGRQDIMVSGLIPLLEGCKVLGASSDHLLVDIEDCTENIKTGGIMSFRMEYGALLSAMTSGYVKKDYVKKQNFIAHRTVSIIKAPVSVGASGPGPETAPAAILKHGLTEKIGELGYGVSEVSPYLTSLAYEPQTDIKSKLEKSRIFNNELASQVSDSVRDESFALVLGGDHTITVGALKGLRKAGRENIGLIVFGAFADFNTAATSPSKNLNGLTLAACARMEPLMGFDGLEQENIVVIGVRQLDGTERDLLKKSCIKIFTMEKIDLLGIREIVSQAVDYLRHCSDGIHVSFGMDAVSPEYAPGVSEPSDGGLSYREAHTAMEIISKSGMAGSMDLAELNPLRDENCRTSKLATGLITSLLGKKII